MGIEINLYSLFILLESKVMKSNSFSAVIALRQIDKMTSGCSLIFIITIVVILFAKIIIKTIISGFFDTIIT